MGKSRFEKHCIICGAKYEFCGNCDRFNHLPRWMETIDNDNCRIIYDVIMDYRVGNKTAKECADILKKCDLSYRDKIKETNEKMDAFITAILAESKEAEQKAESIDIPKETYAVEPKVEEPKAETEKPVEEKHSENKTEKKNFNYKKNYKK
jgi:hypothetical protein